MAGLLFWEKEVSSLDLNESRYCFCRRGSGRSLLAEGPKTKKGMGEKALTSVFCIDGSASHYGRSPCITVIFQYMYTKTTPERFLRDHFWSTHTQL